MKHCSNCATLTDKFSPDKRASDGLQSQCRDCCNTFQNSRNKIHGQPRTSEKRLLYDKTWKAANPGHKAAHVAKRRVAVLQRTPKWLTPTHNQQIVLFYEAAGVLSIEFGVKMHVDHIVPLQGKNVSGLHVPWNLQVIPAKDNIRKQNSYE